jgi:transcriptional regulator with XRE-family HTH domain
VRNPLRFLEPAKNSANLYSHNQIYPIQYPYDAGSRTEVLMREVGAEIRRLREGRGWTGAQLAVYAGMAPSAVSQIETGRRSPNTGSLAKIAKALEVEVVDLFPKEQASLPDFEDERREADTAERLIRFGERMVARFDSELQDRAAAEDLEWFEHARVMYEEYVAILNTVKGRGVSDPQEVLGSLMDMNASMQALMHKYEEVALRLRSRSEEAREAAKAEAGERIPR